MNPLYAEDPEDTFGRGNNVDKGTIGGGHVIAATVLDTHDVGFAFLSGGGSIWFADSTTEKKALYKCCYQNCSVGAFRVHIELISNSNESTKAFHCVTTQASASAPCSAVIHVNICFRRSISVADAKFSK